MSYNLLYFPSVKWNFIRNTAWKLFNCALTCELDLCHVYCGFHGGQMPGKVIFIPNEKKK